MSETKTSNEWYEDNCPSQEELNYLIRKMNRIFGEKTCSICTIARLNFKHLGPAFIVVMLDKYRDKPQMQFITNQKQRIIISMTNAKYIKHGGKVQKLHDEDVELFDKVMRTDAFEGVSTWKFGVSEYNYWFPRYRIKCEQPDYSKLNSR